MGEAEPWPRILNDIFCPPRSPTLSCFNISAVENISLKLKPQYTHILPKFIGIEGAYPNLRDLEDVCSMMCYTSVPIDTVWLKFIPFAVKDKAKKWMYNMLANSITNWDGFVRIFLQNTSLIVKELSYGKNLINLCNLIGSYFALC